MNRIRREKLKNALLLLERVSDIMETILDEEQECLDRIPENFQSGERYAKTEEAVDKLSDATDQLDQLKEIIAELSE